AATPRRPEPPPAADPAETAGPAVDWPSPPLATAGRAEGPAVDETAFGCAGEDPPDRRPPPTGAPGAAGLEPATVAVCGTAGGPDVTGAGAAGTGADETGPGTVT